MTKSDTEKLFNLLSSVYPKAPEFSDKTTLLAWHVVLEPLDYGDVRAAAVAWMRKKVYPPRVSELSAYLAPVETESDTTGGGDRNAWMDPILEKNWAKMDAKGGLCQVLLKYGGVVRETLRQYTPDGCEGCRRRAVSGCQNEDVIHRLKGES